MACNIRWQDHTRHAFCVCKTGLCEIIHSMLFVFVKLVCAKWRLVSAIIAAFENVCTILVFNPEQ